MTACTEGNYTAHDGVQLRTLTWEPEGTPRGAFLIAHGLGEHGGRYGHVAAPLVAAGFVVRALDHRGHGRSTGLRGHVDRFEEFTRDLSGVLAAFRAEFPDLPTLLYGHSLGGLIVLSHHLHHPDHGLDGLVLSNPLIATAFEPPKIKAAAGRLLSRFVPRLRLDNELDTSQLSRDPAEVKAYEDDPLVHRLISTRLFTEMFGAADVLATSADRFRLPTLWIFGEADAIVSAAAGRAFADKLPAGSTTIRAWPATYHEPHNDLDKAEVIAAIVEWATGRLEAAGA